MTESHETELALVRQSVQTMSYQMEKTSSQLDDIAAALHRIELDNKSLYLTDKHQSSRLDEIESKLKIHGLHIDALELASSATQGGLNVAKWAFGAISGIVWGLLSWLLVEAYNEIKSTHDIAILNKQNIEKIYHQEVKQ